MKKPWVVKIVEALGWAYVVLAALAWLGTASSYLRSTCFGCVVVSLAAVIAGLGIAIALPAGMVLSLRGGKKGCVHLSAFGGCLRAFVIAADVECEGHPLCLVCLCLVCRANCLAVSSRSVALVT